MLVVVAHPDDEVLGIGGTLNKLSIESEIEIKVVILGEGLTSRAEKRNVDAFKTELEKHKENITDAQNILGYHDISIYNLPDNRFDSIPLLDIIKIVEYEKMTFKPTIILTHHGGDLNIDHQRTFEAVMTASRPLSEETVSTIITFETPSGTEWRAASDPKHFIPNYYFIINEENIIAKIKAMESYEFERRIYPHPRSPKALKIHAKRNGIIVGCEYAECFVIIRHIENKIAKPYLDVFL